MGWLSILKGRDETGSLLEYDADSMTSPTDHAHHGLVCLVPEFLYIDVIPCLPLQQHLRHLKDWLGENCDRPPLYL